MKRVIGKLLRVGGPVATALSGPAALAAELYVYRNLAIGLAGFGVSAVGLARLGTRLESGSRFDLAVENALRGLFAKPTGGAEERRRGLLNVPQSSDATTPAVRATSFVPVGDTMVAHRRVTSADGECVLRWPTDFSTKVSFKKGGQYVGECWQSGSEVYRHVKALVDFPASNDDDRYAQWSKQFTTNVSTWSAYMQKVRAIWTFPIWGVGGSVLTIISIDSTIARAFDADEAPAPVEERPKKRGGRSTSTPRPATPTPSPTKRDGSCFGMTIREATAATIAGQIYAALGELAKKRG